MKRQSCEQFPKSARLRKRSQYLFVQNNGVKTQSRAFIALSLPNSEHFTRIGITTTKRLGNSVKRNRIKRLVKEAFRRKWLPLPKSFDVVIIAKKSAVSLDSPTIFKDLEILGKRTIAAEEQSF